MNKGVTLSPTPGSSVRFKLNGHVKTMNHPITGKALHTLAGDPVVLLTGGNEVPKNDDLFEVAEDQEFFSKHHLAQPEHIRPEELLPGGTPGVSTHPVDPPQKESSPK